MYNETYNNGESDRIDLYSDILNSGHCYNGYFSYYKHNNTILFNIQKTLYTTTSTIAPTAATATIVTTATIARIVTTATKATIEPTAAKAAIASTAAIVSTATISPTTSTLTTTYTIKQ